jgi:hypothetical protein
MPRSTEPALAPAAVPPKPVTSQPLQPRRAAALPPRRRSPRLRRHSRAEAPPLRRRWRRKTLATAPGEAETAGRQQKKPREVARCARLYAACRAARLGRPPLCAQPPPVFSDKLLPRGPVRRRLTPAAAAHRMRPGRPCSRAGRSGLPPPPCRGHAERAAGGPQPMPIAASPSRPPPAAPAAATDRRDAGACSSRARSPVSAIDPTAETAPPPLAPELASRRRQ